MDPKPYPTSKTSAAIFVARCAARLEQTVWNKETGEEWPRNYNDHKAAQLFKALSDLLIAEAFIDSWRIDLGFNGCQAEEVDLNAELAKGYSSIGGIPCIMPEED